MAKALPFCPERLSFGSLPFNTTLCIFRRTPSVSAFSFHSIRFQRKISPAPSLPGTMAQFTRKIIPAPPARKESLAGSNANVHPLPRKAANNAQRFILAPAVKHSHSDRCASRVGEAAQTAHISFHMESFIAGNKHIMPDAALPFQSKLSIRMNGCCCQGVTA